MDGLDASEHCQHVTRVIETSFKPLKQLIPFDDQKTSMSSAFLYTSYGATWLGEKVHSFMTKELIAMSFKPAIYRGGHNFTRGNESWTAQTRVYQTELSCTPAEINAVEGSGSAYKFSTDRGTHVSYPIVGCNMTRNMKFTLFSDPGDYFDNDTCRKPNSFLAGF